MSCIHGAEDPGDCAACYTNARQARRELTADRERALRALHDATVWAWCQGETRILVAAWGLGYLDGRRGPAGRNGP